MNSTPTLLFLAALPLSAALNEPVKTAAGVVVGVPGNRTSIIAFKGIPFAAPPVGDMRWRAPRPAAPWQGVLKADKFSASCMQTIVTEKKPWTYEFMAHNEVSEDCLYLNVWTPAKTASERRPVFVYIYGGAFTEGSAAVPAYDGEGLATKGIVAVTINYRLGVFGFLAHPELTRESGHNASGNYGLLDQIAALQWIRDNIAKFGGDPARVTIAGQSAGGMSVHDLIASPLAKGLFHRAIVQSGGSMIGGGFGGARKLADAEADGAKYGAAKGAPTLAALRALTAEQLMQAPADGAPRMRFGPIVDGYCLPAPVQQIYTEGKQNDVPTLTGLNKHEGGGTPHPTITVEQFQKQARQRYGDFAEEFLKLYPATTDEEAGEAQNQSSFDQARVSMYLWARMRAKTAKTKAFTYFWDHSLPGPDAGKYGAFHTSEVLYVLNTLYKSDRPFTDTDRSIADMMSSYWANFAAKGDPNGEGLPNWMPVTEQPLTMGVGDTMHATPLAGSAAKQQFFEKFLTR